MGDPSTTAISDGTSSGPHVLPQSTPLVEDDDEPPSSGPHPSRHQSAQQAQGEKKCDEMTLEKEPVPPDIPTSSKSHTNPALVSIDYQPVPPADAHSPGSQKSFFTRRKAVFSRDVEKGSEDDGTAPAHNGDNVPFVANSQPLHESRTVTIMHTTKLSSRLGMLFHPTRPLGPAPTYGQSFKAIVSYNYLNICLAFIPISWALHFTHQSPTLIFVFSCLGIVPLAALLGFGTEQIALRTSDSVGGLLNATLGNIVELIIAGIALGECKLELVQSSLLGGLLSNLLLVLGMAFLVGGYRYSSQEFQPMVAQLNSSLMTVSVMALIVPAAFHEYVGDRLYPGQEVTVLLQLSRGSAVVLMVIYFAYLVFQFYSHSHLFLDTSSISTSTHSIKSPRTSFGRFSTIESQTLPVPAVQSAAPSFTDTEASEVHTPKLNTKAALILLFLVTAVTYFTAENLVDSLEGLVESHPNISQEWLTLIIIPVISNAAEHTTAVVVASKGKFDLAMGVAVGSCIQIALFVIPLLIIVAWGMGKPLTLLFDPLEILVLFFSVLLVKFAVEDGRSHWMSGTVLVCVYVLIALSFWNFPETVRVLQGTPLTCT